MQVWSQQIAALTIGYISTDRRVRLGDNGEDWRLTERRSVTPLSFDETLEMRPDPEGETHPEPLGEVRLESTCLFDRSARTSFNLDDNQYREFYRETYLSRRSELERAAWAFGNRLQTRLRNAPLGVGFQCALYDSVDNRGVEPDPEYQDYAQRVVVCELRNMFQDHAKGYWRDFRREQFGGALVEFVTLDTEQRRAAVADPNATNLVLYPNEPGVLQTCFEAVADFASAVVPGDLDFKFRLGWMEYKGAVQLRPFADHRSELVRNFCVEMSHQRSLETELDENRLRLFTRGYIGERVFVEAFYEELLNHCHESERMGGIAMGINE